MVANHLGEVVNSDKFEVGLSQCCCHEIAP